MESNEIKKRILGKSGLEITSISLGLWAIGGDGFGKTDDQNSLDTIDVFLEVTNN